MKSFLFSRRSFIALAAVLLAGCNNTAISTPTTPSASSAATPVSTINTSTETTATLDSTTATTSTNNAETNTDGTEPNNTLTIMTHGSFALSENVLRSFEQKHRVKVRNLEASDAGDALNKVILSKNAPTADLIFGVDNSLLSKALAADVLVPYASPALANVPDSLKLDKENRLLPVDHGYVTINYDKATATKLGKQPSTLKDLTDPVWKKQLVVQDPEKSSPGLVFLLATVAAFPESSTYTWKDYWKDLKANDVYVSPNWSDAYNNQFIGAGEGGTRALVVSYQSSPAATVFYSEGKLKAPSTASVENTAFQQVEFVGIIKGSKNETLAKAFVDFMLSPEVQADIPLQMFMYPAVKDTPLPEVFNQFAPLPSNTLSLTPEEIDQKRETLLKEWRTIMTAQ